MSLMTDGQAENAPVERDAEGVLTGFRILKYGPLSVTKGTKEGTVAMSGEFTGEHADVIMGNFAAKGAKNPIDCNHMLYALANKAKVDESEVVKVTGRESLAMGYGDLEKRDDGLWMKGVEWSPLGKEIITSKVFRYHSPVLRGMLVSVFRCQCSGERNLIFPDPRHLTPDHFEITIRGLNRLRRNFGTIEQTNNRT